MAEQGSSEETGRKLLSAVERLVKDGEELIAEVESFRDHVPRRKRQSESGYLRAVAKRIIAAYSTRSAIAGGVTAAPSMLPGAGTAIATVGGSLADMAFMLKHEVELALCLTHLYGYDIRDEKERWMAYALAAVSTHDAREARNYFVDLAEAQVEAISKYTPRQISKIVATILGKLALQRAGRSLLRGVPFVGIVVCASANKVLTTNVGRRCVAALSRRRASDRREANEEVVEAKVRP